MEYGNMTWIIEIEMRLIMDGDNLKKIGSFSQAYPSKMHAWMEWMIPGLWWSSSLKCRKRIHLSLWYLLIINTKAQVQYNFLCKMSTRAFWCVVSYKTFIIGILNETPFQWTICPQNNFQNWQTVIICHTRQ